MSQLSESDRHADRQRYDAPGMSVRVVLRSLSRTLPASKPILIKRVGSRKLFHVSRFVRHRFKIKHEGPEEYNNMWQKSRAIWKYINFHYIDDFDWFVLGGDDVFVIVENLRKVGWGCAVQACQPFGRQRPTVGNAHFVPCECFLCSRYKDNVAAKCTVYLAKPLQVVPRNLPRRSIVQLNSFPYASKHYFHPLADSWKHSAPASRNSPSIHV